MQSGVFGLPRWRSHRVVNAAPIVSADKENLTLDLGPYGQVVVPENFFSRSTPSAGDIYMRYADGYESHCPRDQFEPFYKQLDGRPPTIGELRVRLDFNPGGNPQVVEIKRLAAELIDAMRELPAIDNEVARLKALGQTAAEEAAMWGVKGATAL